MSNSRLSRSVKGQRKGKMLAVSINIIGTQTEVTISLSLNASEFQSLTFEPSVVALNPNLLHQQVLVRIR